MRIKYLLIIATLFVFGCGQDVHNTSRNDIDVAWLEIGILRLDTSLQMIDRTNAANTITVRVINFTDKVLLDTCQDECMKCWLNLVFSPDSTEKYLFTDCGRCEITTAINDTTYLSFSSEKLTRHIKERKLNYKGIDWVNSFIELHVFDSTYRCKQSQSFNLCIDTTYNPNSSFKCIKYYSEGKLQPYKFRW